MKYLFNLYQGENLGEEKERFRQKWIEIKFLLPVTPDLVAGVVQWLKKINHFKISSTNQMKKMQINLLYFEILEIIFS